MSNRATRSHQRQILLAEQSTDSECWWTVAGKLSGCCDWWVYQWFWEQSHSGNAHLRRNKHPHQDPFILLSFSYSQLSLLCINYYPDSITGIIISRYTHLFRHHGSLYAAQTLPRLCYYCCCVTKLLLVCLLILLILVMSNSLRVFVTTIH